MADNWASERSLSYVNPYGSVHHDNAHQYTTLKPSVTLAFCVLGDCFILIITFFDKCFNIVTPIRMDDVFFFVSTFYDQFDIKIV